MASFIQDLSEHRVIQEWLLAFNLLILSVAVATLARFILTRLSNREKFRVFSILIPGIYRILLIIGAAFAIEAAPLRTSLNNGIQNLLFVIGVVLTLVLVRRALMIGLDWGMGRSRSVAILEQGFVPLLQNIITLFVLFTGAIVILKRFNYDVMSLITALGVGSLAVGLAAKDTLSHMISGFTLVIDRNLRPGDRINLAGTVGDVEEIGLRSTRIKTGDGNVLIVPNTELANTKILNLSVPTPDTTYSTKIRVPFSVPFERVKAICLETISEVAKIRADRGRWVQLSSVAEGHQVVQIGFWLRTLDDAGEASSEFHERLVRRLKKEGIELISFPQGTGSPSVSLT